MNSVETPFFSAVLKRPLSSSPALLLGFMGSLSLICLLIASVWAYLGARWVLVFAIIDVLALVIAVVWCVRHAMDFERVTLTADDLHVERQLAGRIERWSMPRFYVRIAITEVALGPFKSPRLQISAQQKVLVLGGFCHTAALKQLAKELALALKK